jgi:hypothetical protein
VAAADLGAYLLVRAPADQLADVAAALLKAPQPALGLELDLSGAEGPLSSGEVLRKLGESVAAAQEAAAQQAAAEKAAAAEREARAAPKAAAAAPAVGGGLFAPRRKVSWVAGVALLTAAAGVMEVGGHSCVGHCMQVHDAVGLEPGRLTVACWLERVWCKHDDGVVAAGW